MEKTVLSYEIHENDRISAKIRITNKSIKNRYTIPEFTFVLNKVKVDWIVLQTARQGNIDLAQKNDYSASTLAKMFPSGCEIDLYNTIEDKKSATPERLLAEQIAANVPDKTADELEEKFLDDPEVFEAAKKRAEEFFGSLNI